jgi:hypothetical protein
MLDFSLVRSSSPSLSTQAQRRSSVFDLLPTYSTTIHSIQYLDLTNSLDFRQEFRSAVAAGEDASNGKKMLRLQIINASGALEKDVRIANGSLIPVVFKPGLYICRVYVSESPVANVVKLVIIP